MNTITVIDTINEMKKDGVIIDYAIGGAVGATFYLEPFSTFDVDIFVSFEIPPGTLIISPAPIFDYLKVRGFKMSKDYFLIGGWPVQFLPPNSPLVEDALSEAILKKIGATEARVMTAEHLAAIALELSRPKDQTRLLQFLDEEAIDMPKFSTIIEKFELEDRFEAFKEKFKTDL